MNGRGCALVCRVAFETLQEHRDDIAYRVRFDSSAGAGTRVTFLTEGVLLRMLAAAPLLPQYDVVIIDEVAHPQRPHRWQPPCVLPLPPWVSCVSKGVASFTCECACDKQGVHFQWTYEAERACSPCRCLLACSALCMDSAQPASRSGADTAPPFLWKVEVGMGASARERCVWCRVPGWPQARTCCGR